MAIVLIVVGLVLLVVGAEFLVRGATGLAEAIGVPSLVIGLTVVAYGTSAPELAVSLKAGAEGMSDLAIGNVVGSNTFNVLFILGLSALITPLVANPQLVRVDVPLLIGVSLLVGVLALDHRFSRFEGCLLVIGLVIYTLTLLWMGMRTTRAVARARVKTDPAPEPVNRQRTWLAPVLALVGLTLLVIGARFLVSGASDLARWLGASELLIGLTVVAAGTSLPEVATSVVSAIRGERDIAIGNIVGSNLFNLLGVLGGAAVVAEGGLAVAPSIVSFDIPIMIAVSVVCLPIFLTGGRISRWEGGLLLGSYGAYLSFLILSATGHAAVGGFGKVMMGFVIPLSTLGIALSLGQHWRAQRAKQGSAA